MVGVGSLVELLVLGHLVPGVEHATTLVSKSGRTMAIVSTRDSASCLGRNTPMASQFDVRVWIGGVDF